jgi:hypothetical protein
MMPADEIAGMASIISASTNKRIEREMRIVCSFRLLTLRLPGTALPLRVAWVAPTNCAQSAYTNAGDSNMLLPDEMSVIKPTDLGSLDGYSDSSISVTEFA